MPITPLRVLAADERKPQLEELVRLLASLGHHVIARAVALADVERSIVEDQPDAAVVLVHDDEEHALTLIEEIVDGASCPVVALRETPDPDFIGEAAERGIYAYVQPMNADALRGAIEVAMRRHAETERLEETVDQLTAALQRRAVIERAKGMLMERHGIDEREAFELLRGHARSSNTKVLELARSVTQGVTLER
ncbi:MAG: ANTAR domain-containing protein [Thermoleophilaceae bacterium]|nr:ANTAR domain-containing protein [Thermoleophilaceae bacterium]